MSYTIMKYKAWESIWKKQGKIDDVLVFDEDFASIARAVQAGSSGPEADVWLTFVDFAPIYKFDQAEHIIKAAGNE